MLQVSKLQILNDNILVVGIKPEIVDRVVKGVTTDDKPQEGRVLKVGPGRMLESGKRGEMSVRNGMVVLFNEHSSTKFNLEGKTYFVIKEEDVVGYQ